MIKSCDAHSKCGEVICGACCTIVNNLSVDYGSFRAIESVDLHFHCGELTAIVGPNGGGKSTLLKALLGEVKYSGEIRFKSADGENRQPHIGYVPQSVNVAKDIPVSVTDFLALSLQRIPAWFGITKKSKASALAALELVSAAHLAKRRLGELSGGEFQRVLLARAMNPVPEILLLDEPVSGVDIRGLSLFYETICDLRRKYDISIILVTHDIEAIAPHADRMLIVQKTILADGNPEEVLAHEAMQRVLGHRLLSRVKVPSDPEIHGGAE